MSRELFEGFVHHAGESLGFGGIDFSRGEDCRVRIGEGKAGVEVALSYDEAGDEAVMSSKIGTLLSDRRSECARAFLSRHLCWGDSEGAAYSLNPVSRCVVLARRDKIAATDDESFTSRLIVFLREALWAKSTLENCEDNFGRLMDDAIESEADNPNAVPDNIADLNNLQFRV